MDEKKLNSDTMVKYAKSRSDLAKEKDLMASAQERMAKIHDLNASAEHKQGQADLDMVKTMIELEDMDLQNFKSNLELAEYIKMTREAQSQQTAVAV